MCYFNYTLYKRIKKITFILKIFVPAFVIGCLLLYAFIPQSFIRQKPKIVTVPNRSSLKEIAFKLYNKKVISNPYLFYFIGFISGYSKYIQKGTYYISINESPAEIYHELVNGRVATAKVSIPPGSNIFEIAEILSKHNIAKKKLFLKKCYDKKFLLSIKVNAESAEGFLYPDTYIFNINSNPEDIIKDMVDNFYFKTKKIKPDYKDLIIASLIIKEADEKIKNSTTFVSSVIHNRLKINMPLDIDSTSIYAMNVITYKNYLRNGNTYKVILHMKPQFLKIKSSYNTYLGYGLPPTPIADPDIAAIKAAMHPAKTKYLYYISTKTGKMLFSDNLSGQIKNIDKYLK